MTCYEPPDLRVHSLIFEELASIIHLSLLSTIFKCHIGTMSEINQLRLALQESSTARNVVEGQCISLKVRFL